MSRHLSILGARRVRVKTPDLRLLNGVVSDRILEAMRAASSQLTAVGVRHALVGGLAIGAHGYPRATRDVDFLVGPEAFEVHPGEIVTLKPGVPIQVSGVLVDHLPIRENERFLEAALDEAECGQGVPIAALEIVVCLKLRSPRRKDQVDVLELIKAGGDAERCRRYLEENTPELAAPFLDLVRQAEQESD